jgi:hypothetical protein
MSRKPLLPLAAAVIAVFALANARAQDKAPAPEAAPTTEAKPTPPAKRHPKPIAPPAPMAPTPQSGPAAFSAEKRLENMTARLKLSTDQQAKLKPILEETEAKVKEARAPGAKPQASQDKVKKILEDADNRIRLVLDGEQKAEWEKVKAEVKTQSRTPFKATTLE